MRVTNFKHNVSRQRLTAICGVALLAFILGAPAFAQYPAAPPPNPQQPAQQPLMTPQQLDDLVAPIALYPDPLLGQVLAASTYPLEVVEAQQWLQQNGNLRGENVINAARQQNWDPSVQALVAFPDALSMLNRDIRWTTDLGNAFLAQQQDVMAAVQRMRVRAQANGRLYSNAQETVTTEAQNGQSAVVIEPANPQYIYVPVYNPEYIWGPPVWGYYPPMWYPPAAYGFGFGPGVYLAGFFPGWGIGFGGWGLGWGWGCGWWGGGLFVNISFFNHWGYHPWWGPHFAGGFGAGRLAWEHDPFHRAGTGYANRAVAARFNSSPRFQAGRVERGNFSAAARGGFNGPRGGFNGGPSFNGSRGFSGAASASARDFAGNRGGTATGGGGQRLGNNPSVSARGFSENRGFAAPNGGAQSFRGNPGGSFNSAPRSLAEPRRSYGGDARGFSGGGPAAPRSFGGGGGFSAPRSHGSGGGNTFSGGGHSGGGHGGGRR